MKGVLFTAVLVLLAVNLSTCLPNGAPEEVCEERMSDETTSCPSYTISAGTWAPGQATSSKLSQLSQS